MTDLLHRYVDDLPPHEEAVYACGPPAPVEICQLEQEFEAVLNVYRGAKPMRVLEIGTASGGTLYHWLKDAAEGATIVTVDWDESGYELDKEQCFSWKTDSSELVFVSGDSHSPEIQEEVRADGPYDWLFIDGAHTYQDVKQDWDAYVPMCNPGAYVFLHDIALRRGYPDGSVAGVHVLWREIQAAGLLTQEFRARPHVVAYGIGGVRLPS